MGVNTDRDLPDFPDNVSVKRSELRELGRRLALLANDVANRYSTSGSAIASDKIATEIFPAIVTAPYYAPYSGMGSPPATAQYSMVRQVTARGLGTNDQWSSEQDTVPGLAMNFLGTNTAELDTAGNPISNLVGAGQQVVCMALWNREQAQILSGAYKQISISQKLYIFYFATPSVATLQIISQEASFMGNAGAARYTAAIGVGTVVNLNPLSNFVPPDANMTFPMVANAIAVDVYEGGSAASGTCVITAGSIVLGTQVGTDNSGPPPLPVFYFSSAPSGTSFSVILQPAAAGPGTQGTTTTKNTWAYDGFLFDGSGKQLFANLQPPASTRPNGQFTQALVGFACINNDGTFSLLEALEPPITAACTPVNGYPSSSYYTVGA